jgi:hypothetical protein
LFSVCSSQADALPPHHSSSPSRPPHIGDHLSSGGAPSSASSTPQAIPAVSDDALTRLAANVIEVLKLVSQVCVCMCVCVRVLAHLHVCVYACARLCTPSYSLGTSSYRPPFSLALSPIHLCTHVLRPLLLVVRRTHFGGSTRGPASHLMDCWVRDRGSSKGSNRGRGRGSSSRGSRGRDPARTAPTPSPGCWGVVFRQQGGMSERSRYTAQTSPQHHLLHVRPTLPCPPRLPPSLLPLGCRPPRLPPLKSRPCACCQLCATL